MERGRADGASSPLLEPAPPAAPPSPPAAPPTQRFFPPAPVASASSLSQLLTRRERVAYCRIWLPLLLFLLLCAALAAAGALLTAQPALLLGPGALPLAPALLADAGAGLLVASALAPLLCLGACVWRASPGRAARLRARSSPTRSWSSSCSAATTRWRST